MADDEELFLRFDGAPGDRVFVLTSDTPGYRFHPVRGPFLVSLPPFPQAHSWRYMGEIGASGTLVVGLDAPDLDLLEHGSLHFQGAFLRGKDYFGSSSWTALLDSAW